MKIKTFFYAIGQGIKNLFRNKGYSLASIATISACLFLFGVFSSILVNFQHIVRSAEESVSVTAFFNEGVTEEQIQLLKIAIEEREEVASVVFVSADEAWAEFSKDYLGEYTDGFLENPLEGSDNLEIYLGDVSKQSELVDYLEGLNDVRKVNRSEITAITLSSANRLIMYVSILIILILLIVSVFLISNTIATGIVNHSDEITIMKYIGATDFFVRAPYVFEGLLIGIIGSLIPVYMTYYMYIKAVEIISGRYSILKNLLNFLPAEEVFQYLAPVSIIMGVGIGYIGSKLTIRKHLNV